LFVNIDQWLVTPESDEQAAQLGASTGCPCGDKWQKGVTRTLTSCGQGTCVNTAMFGSSYEQSKGGIKIGSPSFTVAQRTTDAFILGRFDYVPSDGFTNGVGGNDVEPAQFQSDGTNCPAPVMVPDYCGKFEQACTPLVDIAGDTITQSFKAQFEYCGGKAAGDFYLGSAGWFVRNYTLYTDTECTSGKEQISFSETGTMNTGKEATTPGEGASGYQRWAPASSVTAYGSYVSTMQLQCPCGGSWEDGVARLLTQCRSADGATASCIEPGWYGNVSLGQPAYGTIRRLTDNGQDKDEVQFSNPSSDNQQGPNAYLDGIYSTKLQNTDADCPYNSPSYDFCGTWTRDCSADEFSADSTAMIVMTGDGEDDGQMLMYKQYFNPDTACDEGQVQLTIEARGYYSKMIVSDSHPGVLVGYKQILVTATDEGDMVDALNDPNNGCPCGGTWVAGVKRTLTTCPSDSCPGNEIFGAGTLGTPGYGLIQITGGKLQMSVLQTTEADGIYPNGRYELSAFPFELDAACEPEEPQTTVCGNWAQPCQSDGAVTDFQVEFFYETMDSAKSYTMSRSDYTPGTDCDDAPILTVTQAGKLTKTNQKAAVSNGLSVQLEPSTMTITPLSAEIVSRLQGVCACGITWAIGQPQTFTGACPDGTCTDTSWLRQPIGSTSYGSMRHMGESLRMTEFDADMTAGYQNDLQPYDYALSQLDSEPCKPQRPSPSPPSPGPSPPGGGGGGDDDDDNFIWSDDDSGYGPQHGRHGGAGMKIAAAVVGSIFAVASLIAFGYVANKYSNAPLERKDVVKTLVVDEGSAIKAGNWRYPILVGSKLVAVVCLLLSWIFVVANKIGFGKINAMFVVPLNFGCMLTNVWYLHKYVSAGGFSGHDWHREFVGSCVATGLLFVSCCMISATGSSFRLLSKLGGKVQGLPMLNAGAAFSWFGLIAMGISLFGAHSKRNNKASRYGDLPQEVPSMNYESES
jgi:hypothetical protein